MSPESERIEYKQSLNRWREVVESVAAFATATGGVIHVGVSPEGDRVGVPVGRTTLEDLANQIKVNTDPPQYPALEVKGHDDSGVIILKVDESPTKPVWAFGRPFKRVGRTNQRLSREEMQRLVEVTTGRTWDVLPCAGFQLEDIDHQAVESFLRKAGQDVGSTTEGVLKNLRLLTPDFLCNGAAVLFARAPRQFLTEAQVKCGRFRDTTSVDFLDQQTYTDNAFRQLEQAMAFVARNTQQAIRITGKPEREIIPEYPEEAVREAVLNAICHRDYATVGTVQVRIYSDRLEVWNPGRLPPDLTIEALYREHHSHPRNPLIADAFYRARLIEHWGTGTLRMIRECDARGMAPPEFVCERGVFIARFRSPVATGEVKEIPHLSERQNRAVAYVRERGQITRDHYEGLLQVSKRQAVRDLNDLVEMGVFLRKGKGSAVHYVLGGDASMDTRRARGA